MTRLTPSEKGMMVEVLKEDLALINAEVYIQFGALWDKTRKDLEQELGFCEKLKQIQKLNEEIHALQIKIGEIQQSMKEYNQHPTVEEYITAGIDPPKNQDGYIYNHHQKYMGIPINSKMDLNIIRRIRESCDPARPLTMLQEIAASALRAVIMSGTYEEARKAYGDFYALDFHRYGVKIPRLLEEIKKVDGENLMNASTVYTPLIGHKKTETVDKENK